MTELPRPGAAANQECAALAAAAGLHGTRWVAWLAAEGNGPADADDILPTSFMQNAGGGGVQAADQLCQREACSAGLTGSTNCASTAGAQRTFLSYLHTSQQAAWARFDLSGPGWARVDGVDWLPNAEDLATDAAPHLTGMDVHADGSFDFGDNPMWIGGPQGTENCSDWTSSAATGCYGHFRIVDSPLHRPPCSTRSCQEAHKVLCLQQ